MVVAARKVRKPQGVQASCARLRAKLPLTPFIPYATGATALSQQLLQTHFERFNMDGKGAGEGSLLQVLKEEGYGLSKAALARALRDASLRWGKLTPTQVSAHARAATGSLLILATLQEEALGHFQEVKEEYGEEEAVAVIAGMLSHEHEHEHLHGFESMWPH
mgnify:CR=1 FL=1